MRKLCKFRVSNALAHVFDRTLGRNRKELDGPRGLATKCCCVSMALFTHAGLSENLHIYALPSG